MAPVSSSVYEKINTQIDKVLFSDKASTTLTNVSSLESSNLKRHESMERIYRQEETTSSKIPSHSPVISTPRDMDSRTASKLDEYLSSRQSSRIKSLPQSPSFSDITVVETTTSKFG